MIARITTALTPLDQIPPQLDLRPNQKEALRTIIDHFNAPDLALPRTEDTMYTEELSDREMMWLVSNCGKRLTRQWLRATFPWAQSV